MDRSKAKAASPPSTSNSNSNPTSTSTLNSTSLSQIALDEILSIENDPQTIQLVNTARKHLQLRRKQALSRKRSKRKRLVKRGSSPSHFLLPPIEQLDAIAPFARELPGVSAISALMTASTAIYLTPNEVNPQNTSQVYVGTEYETSEYASIDIIRSSLRRKIPFDTWSPKEIALFEAGICQWGKDFYCISRHIRTKTTNECVEFYYRVWKFSAHYRIWKQHCDSLELQPLPKIIKSNLNNDINVNDVQISKQQQQQQQRISNEKPTLLPLLTQDTQQSSLQSNANIDTILKSDEIMQKLAASVTLENMKKDIPELHHLPSDGEGVCRAASLSTTSTSSTSTTKPIYSVDDVLATGLENIQRKRQYMTVQKPFNTISNLSTKPTDDGFVMLEDLDTVHTMTSTGVVGTESQTEPRTKRQKMTYSSSNTDTDTDIDGDGDGDGDVDVDLNVSTNTLTDSTRKIFATTDQQSIESLMRHHTMLRSLATIPQVPLDSPLFTTLKMTSGVLKSTYSTQLTQLAALQYLLQSKEREKEKERDYERFEKEKEGTRESARTKSKKRKADLVEVEAGTAAGAGAEVEAEMEIEIENEKEKQKEEGVGEEDVRAESEMNDDNKDIEKTSEYSKQDIELQENGKSIKDESTSETSIVTEKQGDIQEQILTKDQTQIKQEDSIKTETDIASTPTSTDDGKSISNDDKFTYPNLVNIISELISPTGTIPTSTSTSSSSFAASLKSSANIANIFSTSEAMFMHSNTMSTYLSQYRRLAESISGLLSANIPTSSGYSVEQVLRYNIDTCDIDPEEKSIGQGGYPLYSSYEDENVDVDAYTHIGSTTMNDDESGRSTDYANRSSRSARITQDDEDYTEFPEDRKDLAKLQSIIDVLIEQDHILHSQFVTTNETGHSTTSTSGGIVDSSTGAQGMSSPFYIGPAKYRYPHANTILHQAVERTQSELQSSTAAFIQEKEKQERQEKQEKQEKQGKPTRATRQNRQEKEKQEKIEGHEKEKQSKESEKSDKRPTRSRR